MGCKYYMPENHENLTACEGFYIENNVFFGCKNPDDTQWDKAVTELIIKLKRFIPTLNPVNDWVKHMGISRYVLLENQSVQIVMGDDERYVSLFLIIPETCDNVEKARFVFKMISPVLINYLGRKYPDSVFIRKNSLHLEPLHLENKTTPIKLKHNKLEKQEYVE